MSEDRQSEGNKGKQPGSGKGGGRKPRQSPSAANNAKPPAKSVAADAPAAERPKPAAKSPSTPRHSSSSGGGGDQHQGRGLALLALLIAVVAFGGSGYLWFQFNQAQKTAAGDARLQTALDQGQKNAEALASLQSSVDEKLKAASDERQTALDGVTNQLTDARQKMEASQKSAEEALITRVENLQLAQRGLNDSLETIREAVESGGDSNAWTLSEVDYLLQIADYRLRFQEDVDGALAALTVARQRLGSVNEMAFKPVLLLMDEEIATLRGVQKTDRTAIAHEIAELADGVTKLPVRNDMRTDAIKAKAAEERESLKEGGAEEAEGEDWIDAVAEKAWGEVKNLVVVRHERRSAPPLIAPEEGYFLAENLRLKLEAARLALLLGDGAVYHESLTLAQAWVDNYFEPADENVIAAKNELKTLQQVELHPYLPDISKARRAFQDVMDHRKPLRPLANDAEPAPTSEPAAEGQG